MVFGINDCFADDDSDCSDFFDGTENDDAIVPEGWNEDPPQMPTSTPSIPPSTDLGDPDNPDDVGQVIVCPNTVADPHESVRIWTGTLSEALTTYRAIPDDVSFIKPTQHPLKWGDPGVLAVSTTVPPELLDNTDLTTPYATAPDVWTVAFTTPVILKRMYVFYTGIVRSANPWRMRTYYDGGTFDHNGLGTVFSPSDLDVGTCVGCIIFNLAKTIRGESNDWSFCSNNCFRPMSRDSF